MKQSVKGAMAAAAAAVGMGLAAAQAAPPSTGDLQGAWVESGTACESVYTSGKKGMTFKTPVDVFAPAFIVSGKTLRTPGATCRIRGVEADGQRSKLNLSCTNAVSSAGVSAIFSFDKDGQIRRYFDQSDQTGAAWVQCK